MLKRILVPLDGSSRAEQVMPVVIRLAQASGGTIILLHVVNLTREALDYGTFFPPDVIDNAIKGGQTYLHQLSQRFQPTGTVAVEQLVVSGSPVETILEQAQEQRCQLIVMASHGYTGLKQWLLGSVTERVAHQATVPVLILRDGALLHTHVRADGSPVLRALVPLDMPAGSLDALLPAAELTAAFSAPGPGVLHLIQLLVPPEDTSEVERELLLQNAQDHFDCVGQQVREDLRAHLDTLVQPKVTWSISLDSDIAEGIARVAESGEITVASGRVEGCDLVAMTTQRLSGVQKWMTGSVTDRVLHATRLPLLVVRPAMVQTKETLTHRRLANML